jgi:DNA-binding MarR family transcriptional regulator
LSEDLMSWNSSVYAIHLVGKVRHVMSLVRQNELVPYNISPRQAYVLFLLYKLGHKATLAELAKRCDRGISAISIQMTRMENDGLVTKVREKPKSASLTYKLTEKGLNIYKKSNKMISDKTVMAVLSEQERQQLILMLNKIIGRAEKYKKAKL